MVLDLMVLGQMVYDQIVLDPLGDATQIDSFLLAKVSIYSAMLWT